MLPGIVGSLGAIFLGDMFVPYVRFEVRFWFLALLAILARFQSDYSAVKASTDSGGDHSQALLKQDAQR